MDPDPGGLPYCGSVSASLIDFWFNVGRPLPSEHGLEAFPHTFSSSGVSSANSSASSLDRASTGSASSSSGMPVVVVATSVIPVASVLDLEPN